jgi:hypothetical protein
VGELWGSFFFFFFGCLWSCMKHMDFVVSSWNGSVKVPCGVNNTAAIKHAHTIRRLDPVPSSRYLPCPLPHPTQVAVHHANQIKSKSKQKISSTLEKNSRTTRAANKCHFPLAHHQVTQSPSYTKFLDRPLFLQQPQQMQIATALQISYPLVSSSHHRNPCILRVLRDERETLVGAV